MRKYLLVFPASAAVLLALAGLLAQQPAPAPQEGQRPIKVRVERVPVLFSALDRKER